MAIPHVFSAIKPQDVTQVPIKVNKRYYLDSSTLVDTSSGYKIWSAVHTNKPVPVSAPQAQNDPTNSFDGTYQHLIWNQIDAQYYRYPYDPTKTLEHANKRFTYKFLNYSASILSLPYLDYGESIKPGSVEITCSNFVLSDDKNGNLYDISIDTGSFAPRENLVAYWGFNDAFRSFRYKDGSIDYGRLNYQSNVFEVDRPSYVRNVQFVSGSSGKGQGVLFNNNAAQSQSNTQVSYILTEHRDEFNFGENEDFSICFWVKQPVMNVGTTMLLGKNKFIEKTTYGNQLKYQNDIQVSTTFESRSFVYDPTPIYPFRFDYYRVPPIGTQRRMSFRRSDGINTLFMSSSNLGSLRPSNWLHVACVKNQSQIKLYVDGVLESTATDNTKNTFNKHALSFGSLFESKSATNLNEWASNAALDEVRIYDTALTDANILTLANSTNQSMFQTAVCGNVFYRRGNVVVSGFDSKYHNAFSSGSWSMKYRGTHTIYQNEALVRIAPGDFNLSQNPTVRQSYKSDLLINDMATGSLMSYVTEIGFYNEQGDLLIVGKPNQPIAMRDDTPINIIVQYDV